MGHFRPNPRQPQHLFQLPRHPPLILRIYNLSRFFNKLCFPIFKIDFDNKTLEGYWVIGDDLSQGSLGSISNGIIEQAHFKLKKK